MTTLFEHKNAVNTLAITENSQLFFTGSKLDQQVKIWKTTEFEDDVTSHSHFSIPTRIPVNQITTFDYYIAVAGGQGTIDIYSIPRIE